MAQPESFDASARRRSVRLDLAVAVALAVILTTGWAITDWTRLSRMLLPDADDMMRLAQVRDWLAGQGINDWTQYRMAPPLGAPMHWSRVNDIGIAALILLAKPFFGQPHAELIAILVYPALLFACAIFLSARIARGLWEPSAGPVAAVLTAVAYPGTAVFIPGRIDHHGLQVVLVQILVLLLARTPSWKGGAAAGVVAATSLVVGLETAPQVAVLIATTAMFWVAFGIDERARLAGLAAGLGTTTLFFLAFLRPTYWNSALCDAFTPASATAALATAAALGVLAAATGWLPGWRSRIGISAVLGATVLGGVLAVFPGCLQGPYGTMAPFLRVAFLPFIEEANGIFRQPGLVRIIALAGGSTAACLVLLWMFVRDRMCRRTLLPIAAVIAASAMTMLFQLRGVYIAAPLGAPVLAKLVVAARQRKTKQLATTIAAWLAGAGVAYSAVPKQIERLAARGTVTAQPPTSYALCSAGDEWRQIDRYPPGIVMAATNVAAYLIGATHHSTVAASYHRNDAGNMAMYRFFLNSPDSAIEIARKWRSDYVIFCPDDFTEIDLARNYPKSLAARLQRGEAVSWLERLPLHDTPLRLYRVR